METLLYTSLVGLLTLMVIWLGGPRVCDSIPPSTQLALRDMNFPVICTTSPYRRSPNEEATQEVSPSKETETAL
jgi:hypothetical protein